MFEHVIYDTSQNFSMIFARNFVLIKEVSHILYILVLVVYHGEEDNSIICNSLLTDRIQYK